MVIQHVLAFHSTCMYHLLQFHRIEQWNNIGFWASERFWKLVTIKGEQYLHAGRLRKLVSNEPFVCLLLMGYSRKMSKQGGLLKPVSRLVETAALVCLGLGGFSHVLF